MKEACKHIAILFGSIFLIVIAIIIVTALIIPALLWKIVVSISSEKRKARDILSGTATFFVAIASSIDKFGNVAYGGFLSNLLLIDQKHPFGETTETVSIVLGWSYRYNDLNKTGLMLRAVVNWIDFTVKDHCEHSRMLSIKRAKEIISKYEKL